MNKYTPGTWEVIICDDGKEWSGWPLSIVQKDTDKTIVRQGGHWPYIWDESISRDEALANAHLIAAAPELLEALELLIDDLALRAKLRGDDCLDVSDGRLHKAQNAIAKAKGE